MHSPQQFIDSKEMQRSNNGRQGRRKSNMSIQHVADIRELEKRKCFAEDSFGSVILPFQAPKDMVQFKNWPSRIIQKRDFIKQIDTSSPNKRSSEYDCNMEPREVLDQLESNFIKPKAKNNQPKCKQECTNSMINVNNCSRSGLPRSRCVIDGQDAPK